MPIQKFIKLTKNRTREIKMKKIFVTVVIPVKNGEKTIARTLNSALRQDYKNFEVIVVDDCSNDNTIKILKSYGNKIKLIKNKKNLGPAASRNKGIKKARGEIIFFTDSDCFVPINWISKILKEYKNEKIAGVGGYLKPWKNNWVAFLEHLQNKFILGIKNKKIINGLRTPMGYTNNASYRKKVLEEVNGFDEKFPQPAGEDIDLKRKICEKGYLVVYAPFPVVHLDTYDLDYLVNRIITRGLDKKPPNNKIFKFIYAIITLPISFFRVIAKIIKYKFKNLI